MPMIETVGFLELNSIAKGVEAADYILKAAEVDLAFAKPVCPGKYSILFTGEVAAVKASMDAGVKAGENFIVDSTVIPRVHPQVIKAINQSTERIGGKSFVIMTGDVAAVKASVDAGSAEGKENGLLVSSVVIPSPRPEIFDSLM